MNKQSPTIVKLDKKDWIFYPHLNEYTHDRWETHWIEKRINMNKNFNNGNDYWGWYNAVEKKEYMVEWLME